MTTESTLFLLLFTASTSIYLAWGFKNLVAERWQILAAVPENKDAGGLWHGTNFTYYGFFTANAYAGGTAIYLLLSVAAGIAAPLAAAMLAALLLVCAPASRVIAQWVEKKKSGFTVGGASFLGILMIPWAALLCERAAQQTRGAVALPLLAAATIAYACGEALGRLACISFGCCYGKPIEQAPRPLRPLFRRWNFVFIGATKKVAYESGMEGAPLIPIQAVTAAVLSMIAIAAIALFLASNWKAAFLTAGIGSQIWRILSEFLRADDRGGAAHRFSAYQWMSLFSIPYMLAAAWLLPAGVSDVPVAILRGLKTLNTPAILLSLQLLWGIIFVYMGKSSVTGSTLSFHVRKENL